MIKPRGRHSIPKVLIGFGRHLVFAEGTKTEFLYVKDLKDLIAAKLNVEPRDVEIIPVPSKQTMHTIELVNFAKESVTKRRIAGETIDHV